MVPEIDNEKDAQKSSHKSFALHPLGHFKISWDLIMSSIYLLSVFLTAFTVTFELEPL